ncbi:hypothetical protein ILYODFUR_022457 [Ilyodon furcidens]|uniref:Secreted protein n=1 Tax=Ilyodon furcidens TaxID=33524 RepID=A0ABV0TDQ9_9TELE
MCKCLLFLPIESTPGSVLLCSLCVSALFSLTPIRSWHMAAHTGPSSAGGFFLLEGSFSTPLSLHACLVWGIAAGSTPVTVHCFYMLIREEGMLQVADWMQSAGFPWTEKLFIQFE